MHTAGTIAAAAVVTAWSASAGAPEWGLTAVLAAAAVSGYALLVDNRWPAVSGRASRWRGRRAPRSSSASCRSSLRVDGGAMPAFPVLRRWRTSSTCARCSRSPRSIAGRFWRSAPSCPRGWRCSSGRPGPTWRSCGRGCWRCRRPSTRCLPCIRSSSAAACATAAIRTSRRCWRAPWRFFGARAAFVAGELDWMIGAIPVIEGAVLALMLRSLLSLESRGQRDLGRLALVAGAALAFVTVAIPLQLKQQWITIGWALEGAALAWVYTRIPHRGLLYSGIALLGAVFVRLALNPEVLVYEPRGSMRILNWYLYAYLLCAAAMFVAGWFLSKTNDRLAGGLRVSSRSAGRRRRPVVPAAQYRDRRLLRHRTDDHVQVRRHGRAGSDVHDRLAGIRHGAACRRDHPRQSSGSRGGRDAHRGDDVQVFPLRPRLARRAASRGVVRRPGDLARARVARASEVRPQDRGPRRETERAPCAAIAAASMVAAHASPGPRAAGIRADATSAPS